MIYPDLIVKLEKNPSLINKVLARDTGSDFTFWVANESLKNLLYAEPSDFLKQLPAWAMTGVDWLPLLETTPLYRSPTDDHTDQSGILNFSSNGTTTTTTSPFSSTRPTSGDRQSGTMAA